MKHRWMVLSTSILLLVGCNAESSLKNNALRSAEGSSRKESGIEKNTKVFSEAIVVFKKGISVEEAEKIIASYDMKVLKVYQSISKSTQKPMLHVGASENLKEMLKELKEDRRIISISANNERHILSQ